LVNVPTKLPREPVFVGVNALRRTIKLTERQRHMVLAMFAGNEEGDHYTDEEIRELMNLIWEWQWGVGRALLDAFNVQGGAQAAE
jgi:hypothetical protein